jgi:hypothetical protein
VKERLGPYAYRGGRYDERPVLARFCFGSHFFRFDCARSGAANLERGRGTYKTKPSDYRKSCRVSKPGVLQIEFGYDGNFRSDEFRSQQTLPLTVRYAPVEQLLLDVNVDTLIFEKDEMGISERGVGDTRIGLQLLALKDTEEQSALAFAYYIKLPTASAEKNLVRADRSSFRRSCEQEIW